jgi:hypothetical protein
LISRRLSQVPSVRRGNFTQIFQHAFFDLQTSNLLLVCQ